MKERNKTRGKLIVDVSFVFYTNIFWWNKFSLYDAVHFQSLSKSQKSASEEDIAKKMLDVDSKDKLKSSTLPSSKNRARSMGVGKSDTDLDDTTDEMMDMLVKTVTSNQSKSRVRRRERSSMANRKSRKIFHSRFLTICYFHDSL